MLLLQRLSSASVAFTIAAWFSASDDETVALTMSGLVTVPAWLHGFGPRHSAWQELASLFALMPYAPLLLFLSFCLLPPSRGRTGAHVVRLLHCASWLVGVWTVIVDSAEF